ncbi:protein of unknown function DUF481 [Desulfovibrio sp. X2]|uniref:DUF481 domain-containing protein n=1 Tax=Desulfovibrio sp. X2 TaxID=941449 RepID=UPI000358BBD2|nr:DUF481 domain-containing protein [Desulfovibrio sp. X2]EPR42119.1 protein of unknown function DUF481 [Desulfovibrio sp. X2]
MTCFRLACRFASAFCLLLLLGAQARADTVVMKNGDRLSGMVVNMENGKLTLSTDYAGTLTIDWAAVARVESEKPMTVYAPDGEAKSRTVIETRTGKVEAVNANPGRWKVSADVSAGWINQTGNTDSQETRADAKVKARKDDDRYKLDGHFEWQQDDDTRTAYNWYAQPAYDRFLGEHLYWTFLGRLEHDEFQDLRLRKVLGTGPGWQILDNDIASLSVEFGPAYVWESYNGDRNDDDFPAARWQLSAEVWLWKDWVQFFHDDQILASFKASDEVLLESATGLRFPLTAGFNLTLEYDHDWRNNPAPGTRRTDDTTMLKLGYQFR